MPCVFCGIVSGQITNSNAYGKIAKNTYGTISLFTLRTTKSLKLIYSLKKIPDKKKYSDILMFMSAMFISNPKGK